MGITHASIEVKNLFTKRRMSIAALVDSGAVFMAIPEHIALQLGYDLEDVSQREVVLAHGSRKTVPLVGGRCECISPNAIATCPPWFWAMNRYLVRCRWK